VSGVRRLALVVPAQTWPEMRRRMWVPESTPLRTSDIGQVLSIQTCDLFFHAAIRMSHYDWGILLLRISFFSARNRET
jgi:hypothetical protein